MQTASELDDLPSIRKWDPLVRLTHWGIAAAIVANRLLTEEGSTFHLWVGYAAAALLALRLLWGFIGPAEARFSAFPPSLRRAANHVGDIFAGRKTLHRSHNPLGALMAYALWGTLAVVIGTGVAMAGLPSASPRPDLPAGAEQTLVRHVGREDGEREAEEHDELGEGAATGEREGGEKGEGEHGMIGEIHEVGANLLFVLAALHLAGVAFETRRSGPHVVRAMLGVGRPSEAK